MRRTVMLLVLSAFLAATMMWVFVGTPARGQTPQLSLRKTQIHTEMQGQVTTSSLVPLGFSIRVNGTREATIVADENTVLWLGVESGLQHTIAVSELRVGDIVTVNGTVLVDGRVLAEVVKVAPRLTQASR